MKKNLQQKIKEEFEKHNLTPPENLIAGSGNIPEEIENAFVKNVVAFELQAQMKKMCTIFEFIGKPAFIPFQDVAPDDLFENLEQLYDTMEIHGIYLNTCDNYPDDVIYKFITEEFFQHEIKDIRVPGSMLLFEYESFHPNIPFQLGRVTEDLITCFFNSNGMNYTPDIHLENEVYINTKKYSKEDFVLFLKNYMEFHDAVELQDYEIKNTTVEETIGRVEASVKVCLAFNDGIQEEKEEMMGFHYHLKNGMEFLYKVETKLW